LALGLLAAGPVRAQMSFPISLPNGTLPVAQSIAEDGETGAFVKYIGSSACASVAVAANGDLTFTEGPCGSEVAVTTFECPVSGALGGIIDVSDAACDTIGEVANIVNTSASGWRFIPYAMLLADSSNDTFVTISATQATDPAGLALKVDSSVALFATLPIAPTTVDYRDFSLGPQSTGFKRKPYVQNFGILTALSTLSTYGSGTSLVKVIAVDRTLGTTTTETVTTAWPNVANGATTVAKVFGSCDTPATGCDTAWGPGGLVCPLGQLCMIRLTNSAALSVNTIAINGFYAPNSGLGLTGAH
jgi:hypothetical protein